MSTFQNGNTCPGCAGSAPTHTCESYSPEAARRGAATVLRAADRELGWRGWGKKTERSWELSAYDPHWCAQGDPCDRQTARLLLRGLLLPQIVEQARHMSQLDYLRMRARLEDAR